MALPAPGLRPAAPAPAPPPAAGPDIDRLMGLRRLSIRTKLGVLLTGLALLVGGISAVYSSVRSGRLLRDQIVRRGRFIADHLAKRGLYPVMTEDKQELTSLATSAMEAGVAHGEGDDARRSESRSDVIGVIIRDARGGVLVQRWAPGVGTRVRGQADAPVTAFEERDAVTDAGVFSDPSAWNTGAIQTTSKLCHSPGLRIALASGADCL